MLLHSKESMLHVLQTEDKQQEVNDQTTPPEMESLKLGLVKRKETHWNPNVERKPWRSEHVIG